MANLPALQYARQQRLEELCSAESVVQYEIEEDNEEEADSLVNAMSYDSQVEREGYTMEYMTQDQKLKLQPSYQAEKRDFTRYTERLKMASAQILVGSTRKEYEKLWEGFTQFCKAETFVSSVGAFEARCASNDIPANTPTWIALWIMDKCDKIDLKTGKTRALEARPSYSTAQKMRAAMSHKFGRDYGRGQQAWTENMLSPGSYFGNPSISMAVSQYMIHDGEVAVSARAIDEMLIKRLIMYNCDKTRFTDIDVSNDPAPQKRKKPDDEPSWDSSYQLRAMLNCIYLFAFLCLLRFDEALNIEWASITLEDLHDGPRLKLMLPFRKTHQTGGIAPFYLYPNKNTPWLCPFNAFFAFRQCVTTTHGWLFRRRIGATFSQQKDQPMSAESFLQCFRNNLLDVGVDPRPFGTHSFRRGGCQYLANTLRWPIRDICAWGGWAENFDNPVIIFKYLIGFVDTCALSREDYFNPNRAQADPCAECHRTCHCR